MMFLEHGHAPHPGGDNLQYQNKRCPCERCAHVLGTKVRKSIAEAKQRYVCEIDKSGWGRGALMGGGIYRENTLSGFVFVYLFTSQDLILA